MYVVFTEFPVLEADTLVLRQLRCRTGPIFNAISLPSWPSITIGGLGLWQKGGVCPSSKRATRKSSLFAGA